jgi:cathepsin L
VGLLSAHPTPQLNNDLDSSWELFKAQYNKAYEPKYEFVRRLIWESNVQYIQKHNLEYDMGKHTYGLGVNEFADLTFEEFSSMYLAPKRDYSQVKLNGSQFMTPLNMKDLPTEVDWRKQGLVTPVKNQGQCGSCWAFSTTGSLEGQYKRKSGNLVSLSEQQLVDCSRSYGNMGCNGGLMDQAFNYIKDYGIEREEDYPYTARDGQCKYDKTKVVTKDNGPSDIVPTGDEDQLKQAVATVGPISVAIDAGHMSFQFYKHGVYSEPSCSSTRLDHGVLAVGYGVDPKSQEPYWLVKNSWGGTWGNAGYIWMSKDKDNQCVIATQASYPLL